MASVHQKHPPPNVAVSVLFVELFISLVWANPGTPPQSSKPSHKQMLRVRFIGFNSLKLRTSFCRRQPSKPYSLRQSHSIGFGEHAPRISTASSRLRSTPRPTGAVLRAGV